MAFSWGFMDDLGTSGATMEVLRGTPPGIRTQNLRIKSPLLCQLS